MGKKKRLQMQKSITRPSQRQRPLKEPLEELTEAQEQEHRDWISRHGYDYISLAETVRVWQRSPKQILRWERKLDSQGIFAG